MKVSVSLPEDDLAALDEYARRQGLKSRSAAVQHVIRLLRHPDLEQNYAEAWQEWAQAGGEAGWEAIAGDGLTDAAQ